jgi:hypothetical protein
MSPSGEGQVSLDAKTDRLTHYALQSALDFSRLVGLTYIENEENYFPYPI